jgi:hypothetical protein
MASQNFMIVTSAFRSRQDTRNGFPTVKYAQKESLGKKRRIEKMTSSFARYRLQFLAC